MTLAYACSKREEHDFNMEMYQEPIPMAKKCGIVICLENMFIDQKAHLTEGACSDFVEAAAWIDELNGIAGRRFLDFALMWVMRIYWARICISPYLHWADG